MMGGVHEWLQCIYCKWISYSAAHLEKYRALYQGSIFSNKRSTNSYSKNRISFFGGGGLVES